MEVNPYQPSVDDSVRPQSTEPSPVMIYVLCVLVAIHALMAAAITLVGLLVPLPAAFMGGAISFVFNIAIMIGLLRKAEWARITLIWMCYVGLIANATQVASAAWIIVPILVLEVITLIIAHGSSIRVITQTASTAKAYIYTESNANTQEPT